MTEKDEKRVIENSTIFKEKSKLIPDIRSLEEMEGLRGKWQGWRGEYENELELRTIPQYEGIKTKMSEWVYSEPGLQTMEKITRKINEAVFNGEFANTPPSHDLRHYLCDLSESMRVIWEKISSVSREGWLIATVVPSMWHDFGKGAEAKLNKEHVSGVKGTDHAIIATEALEAFLETNGGDIPLEMRNQMLYAVLTHQEGKSVPGEYMSKVVASADSSQLVGSEGTRRMLVCDAGLGKAKITENPDRELTVKLPLPGREEDNDLGGHIMFYVRNLYSQATDAAQERADKGKVSSASFVYLTASPEARAVYFAPEMRTYEGLSIAEDLKEYELGLGGKTFNKPMSLEMWKEIKNADNIAKYYEENVYPNMTVEELLAAYIWRKNANPKDTDPVTGETIDIEPRLEEQLKVLTPEARKRWQRAFAYSLHEIDKEDDKIVLELCGILEDALFPDFYRNMAAMAYSAMTSGKVEIGK